MENLLISALESMFNASDVDIKNKKQNLWICLYYGKKSFMKDYTFTFGRLYLRELLVRNFTPAFPFMHNYNIVALCELEDVQTCLHTYTYMQFRQYVQKGKAHKHE